MGACFHTQDVTCDNCRSFNINIGSRHGGTCNCPTCRQTAYIPAVPMPQAVPLPYIPPPGDMVGPTPLRLSDLINQKDRRERIATAAMQGLVNTPLPAQYRTVEWLAQEAVRIADALIAELDKEAK